MSVWGQDKAIPWHAPSKRNHICQCREEPCSPKSRSWYASIILRYRFGMFKLSPFRCIHVKSAPAGPGNPKPLAWHSSHVASLRLMSSTVTLALLPVCTTKASVSGLLQPRSQCWAFLCETLHFASKMIKGHKDWRNHLRL